MKDETDKRLDEEYLRSLMAGTGPDAAAHGTFPSERPEHTLPRSKSALHLPCDDYTARFLVSRPCNERQESISTGRCTAKSPLLSGFSASGT